MVEKPYKDWEELKKDIVKWRRINLCCIFFAILCIIVRAAAETLPESLGISFS